MTVLGHIAAFVLGVYLSIRMIAALYQVLDLWYRIGAEYPRVVRGVVGWALTIAAIAWLLDGTGRTFFGSGLVAFLLFYLSLYGLRHLLIGALREPAGPASAVAGPDARLEEGGGKRGG